MAGIPPLRNIRKTTVILVAVLLAFLVHRTVAYLSTDDSIKDAGNTELSLAQGTVCRHIVKETPFGADSVFEEGSRLYFYTTISSALKDREDTLWHGYGAGVALQPEERFRSLHYGNSACLAETRRMERGFGFGTQAPL